MLDLSSVQPWFDSKNACYILFRHDSTFSNGDFQWMLLIYIPDNAKVRDKMLYASSRATLLRELGEQRFVDTLFGTAPVRPLDRVFEILRSDLSLIFTVL